MTWTFLCVQPDQALHQVEVEGQGAWTLSGVLAKMRADGYNPVAMMLEDGSQQLLPGELPHG